ncbi:MAG: hypothetical protein NVSMB43_27640 [Pseudarthrobacter sp.]
MRALYSLGIPSLAVATALALGAVIILATGGDAVRAFQGLWEGSLGRPQSISDTLATAFKASHFPSICSWRSARGRSPVRYGEPFPAF